MTSISRVPPVVVHHEIDLFSVMQAVWRQKKIIASAAMCGGLIAALYVFLATPEYEVSTVLRPAALNDLDALNRSGIYSLPPAKALVRVGAALDSYDTRLNYFRSRPKLVEVFSSPGGTAEQAFERFNRNALKVVQPDPKKTDLLSSYIGLEMRYPAGLRGDNILNGFVQYAIERERAEISDDLRVIISNRIVEIDEKLSAALNEHNNKKESKIARLLEDDAIKRAQFKDELNALRVLLKARRENRIAVLNEAIDVARSLGLKKPSTPSSMASDSSSSGNVIRTEFNNQDIPLYFMGTDALEAERKVLRQRVSDDFSDPRIAQIRKELLLLKANRKVEVLTQRENEDVFLDGIEELRAERARLGKVNTDMQNLILVSVDQSAVQPLSPIKPKKILIILMGGAIGAFLGLVISIIRNLSANRNPVSESELNRKGLKEI